MSIRDCQLILAMIDAGLKDQQIHAFFSQPGCDFNHNKISALRRASRTNLPPPASLAELQDFLDHWAAAQRFPSLWNARNRNGPGFEVWRLRYRFHPVGQGTLHSGELRQGQRAPFTWIYDCGSVTSQATVEAELDALCNQRVTTVAPKPSIDFVVLSHFDKDHVSGIVHLLGLFEVRLLLLPFLTLWQRLWIAAAADDLDVDFLQFLIDPVGYVREVEGGGATRIVFVPPSAGNPPAAPADGSPEVGPRGTFDDRPMKLRLQTESAPHVVDGEIGGVTGKRFPEAEFLKNESVLDIDGLWKFVPFNDARQAARCPNDFPATVEPLIQILLAAKNASDRKAAFDALKAHYDKTFGNGGYRRNIISLFLYGGPVATPAEAAFETGAMVGRDPCFSFFPDRTGLSASHFSILFTGDGSLNSKPRRAAFKDFFMPYGRLETVSVFQVMHHGASGNSSPEVAPLVAPRASIFCSDPKQGEKHPDANVLRQFWPYNCVQVDGSVGWMMVGLFAF